MPIKIPKSFARRKTSGNVLEEVENPPEPSFRVIERSDVASRSFDGGHALKRRSLGRPLSAEPELDGHLHVKRGANSNAGHRGSGGTHSSVSSGGLYDNSSSSARFSSSSTLPSPNDVTPDEDPLTDSKDPYNAPFPAVPHSQSPFSLRAAAGSTFSFGRKPPSSSTTLPLAARSDTSYIDSQEQRNGPRERALTDSSYASVSTATPSKFLGTDLDLEESDLDEFGNMFEGLGRRWSRQPSDEQGSMGMANSASPEPMAPPGPAVPTGQFSTARSLHTPPPTNIFRLRDGESSSYLAASHGSRDGLMTSFSPPAAGEPSFDYGDSPPLPRHRQGMSASKYEPLGDRNSATNRRGSDRIGTTAASAGQRFSVYVPRRDSSPMQDEDARLLMNSPGASREWNTEGKNRSQVSSSDGSSTVPASSSGLVNFPKSSKTENILRKSVAFSDGDDPNIPSSEDSWTMESAETTPRPKKLEPVQLEEPSLSDTSFTEAAILAVRFQEGDGQGEQDQRERPPVGKGPKTKVMTPEQFDHYRKEQEMWRIKFNAPRSEPSQDGSDNAEDEDDAERNRQLVKQRRKQEAHLAVYRQQMMKVIGEKLLDPPSQNQPRLVLPRASLSSPNLSAGMSSISLGIGKPAQSAKNSDDEDEDIPLGILAAHGFPSKSRSPTATSMAGATPSIRYQSETYPPPQASVAGGSASGRPRSGLPVFARNLPPDPYYGASLVNPSNRESLAFGNGGRSIHGGNQPHLPPGGLVGVIAGEERAKALRRGSANVQGGFGGDPNMFGSGSPQMHPGMSRSMTMGNLGSMGPEGMAGSPPVPMMMTPGDQAQIQMSQQLAQMMQMQMQWMQQIQQMVQMQGVQPAQQQGPSLPPQHQQMATNNGFLTPPGTQMSRPKSLGPQSAVFSNPGALLRDQRVMSMVDSSMHSQWPQQRNSRNSSYAPSMMTGALGAGQGYTPSIAPSERSNVGMASRYRPVSIVEPTDDGKMMRKSSGTSLPGWNEEQANISMTGRNVGVGKKKIRIGGPSDEDDEEGWEEMRKSMEKKKSAWRLRRKDDGDGGLGGMFYQGT